jgi:hypothetical protein
MQRDANEDDSDADNAYLRLRASVMVATMSAPESIQRKGDSVSAHFLEALACGRSSFAREATWRRFITLTASLNRNLECSELTAIDDAVIRAREALVRIVDENADLLEVQRVAHLLDEPLLS